MKKILGYLLSATLLLGSCTPEKDASEESLDRLAEIADSTIRAEAALQDTAAATAADTGTVPPQDAWKEHMLSRRQIERENIAETADWDLRLILDSVSRMPDTLLSLGTLMKEFNAKYSKTPGYEATGAILRAFNAADSTYSLTTVLRLRDNVASENTYYDNGIKRSDTLTATLMDTVEMRQLQAREAKAEAAYFNLCMLRDSLSRLKVRPLLRTPLENFNKAHSTKLLEVNGMINSLNPADSASAVVRAVDKQTGAKTMVCNGRIRR